MIRRVGPFRVYSVEREYLPQNFDTSITLSVGTWRVFTHIDTAWRERKWTADELALLFGATVYWHAPDYNPEYGYVMTFCCEPAAFRQRPKLLSLLKHRAARLTAAQALQPQLEEALF